MGNLVRIGDKYLWNLDLHSFIDEDKDGEPVDPLEFSRDSSVPEERAIRLIYDAIVNAPSLAHPSPDIAKDPIQPPDQPQKRHKPEAVKLYSDDQQTPSGPLLAFPGDNMLGSPHHYIITSQGKVALANGRMPIGESLGYYELKGDKYEFLEAAADRHLFFEWKSAVLRAITIEDMPCTGDFARVHDHLVRLSPNSSETHEIVAQFTVVGMSDRALSLHIFTSDGRKELRMFGSAHKIFYKLFRLSDFSNQDDVFKIRLNGRFSAPKAGLMNPKYVNAPVQILNTEAWQCLLAAKLGELESME